MARQNEKDEVAAALADLGFQAEHTGGNCMAYFRYLGAGPMEPHLVITEGCDPILPESWRSPVFLGRYESAEHGEPSASEEYETVRSFIEAVKAGESELVRVS
jgi:hypothetical protein